MSKIYFSPKKLSFFPEDFIEDYKQAGTWPDDAIEISEEKYTELKFGLLSGKVLSVDIAGNPILVSQPKQTVSEMASSLRSNRDLLISSTDYLVMPDYPISADLLAKVKAYRQALRDIPEQVGFPADIDWPINPMDEVTA